MRGPTVGPSLPTLGDPTRRAPILSARHPVGKQRTVRIVITLSDSPETPNPQVQPEALSTPPPPQPPATPPPSTNSGFDSDAFFTKLNEQFTGLGEQLVNGIREAFPATPPVTPPPVSDPPKDEKPPADTPPKDDAPVVPGRKTIAQRWFG